MELLSEGPTVDCTMAHPVMESTIVIGSGALRVRRKWSRTPQPGLVLDGAEDPIDGDLERSEVSVNLVDLNGVLGRTYLRSFLETVRPPVLVFFRRADGCFAFSPPLSYLESRLVEPVSLLPTERTSGSR